MNARRRQITQLRREVPSDYADDLDLTTSEGREAAILAEISAVRQGRRRGVDAKAVVDMIVLYGSLLAGEGMSSTTLLGYPPGTESRIIGPLRVHRIIFVRGET